MIAARVILSKTKSLRHTQSIARAERYRTFLKAVLVLLDWPKTSTVVTLPRDDPTQLEQRKKDEMIELTTALRIVERRIAFFIVAVLLGVQHSCSLSNLR